MSLSELIFKRLSSDSFLEEHLAKYAGIPAVFDTEFPGDQQEGWGGMTQYPRICYRIDLQVNTERASTGQLHVTVYTERNSLIVDALEGSVKRCLKDVLIQPSEEAPFCFAWSSTDPYVIEGMGVICRDLVFDILEYPLQETTDPDPVMAVSWFVKSMYPEALVIGIDRLEEFTEASKRPVFYCRLEDIQSTTGYCMNTIAWFISKVAIHLIYPNSVTRLKTVAAIQQKMAVETEIIMLDQSPMAIQTLSMNNKADYLRSGQLVVTGKYGCLRGGEKKKGVLPHIAGFTR